MSAPVEGRVDGPAGSQHAGAIHDIGYRHYDGPRLGRRAVQRSLFLDSARGAYGLGRAGRTKVVPALLLAAMCLPALITGVVASVVGLDELPLSYTAYAVTLAPLVSVFVATQAPASVSKDLRFRVVSLYFSRPMQRVDYVQAKYAGLALAVLVFLCAPLLVLLAAALLAEMPLGEQLPGLARALAGAVLLSLVLAGIGLVLAAATPRRGLGVAAIITVLVVLTSVQGSVMGIALSQVPERTALAGWVGVVQPFTLVDGVLVRLLGAESAMPAAPPGVLGGAVFAAVAVAVVLGCYALLVLRYRRVSVS